MTVIRVTQDGIFIKSTDAPDVGVTAVANTLGASVPVPAASVIVFVPAIAGAAMDTAPLVSPEIVMLLIGSPNASQTRR